MRKDDIELYAFLFLIVAIIILIAIPTTLGSIYNWSTWKIIGAIVVEIVVISVGLYLYLKLS